MENSDQKKQENQNNNSLITRYLIALVIIGFTIFSAFLISRTSNYSTTPKSKLVDPNTVTEKQKLEGFTTERILNHYNELKDKYFADYKSQFEGWTIQYKKNEEWSNASWTTLEGKTNSGAYYGVCDYANKTIYLNDSYFPRFDSHDDVILHEMIHVITQDEGHQGKFLEECKRVSKLSRIPVNKIYGYDGLGSVE